MVDPGQQRYQFAAFHRWQTPAIYQTARQFALLRWNCAHISFESIEFLRGLPLQQVIALDDGYSIRVVHGSIDNPYDGYDPEGEAEKFAADLQRLIENVLICGHTHRP